MAGWFVASASSDVGAEGVSDATIANSSGELVAGVGNSPHLGALLDKRPVIDGTSTAADTASH